MHLLARFSKVVLGLALLSWPVIGYSLRIQMSNTDWLDSIFKPKRIAADVNNCVFSPNEDGCKTLDFWLLPVIFIPKLSTSHHSIDVLKSRVATPKKTHNSAVAAERNG